MELRILDTNFNLVVILDEMESVLWHRKFNELGSCEIYVPCNDEYLEYLRKDAKMMRWPASLQKERLLQMSKETII